MPRDHVFRATFVLLAAAAATPALAIDPVFWATEDSTLYRTTLGGGVTSFTLSDDIVGITRGPDGRVYASSASPTIGGTFELYELDLSGSPTLHLLTDGLSRPYNSLTFVGNELWGAERMNLATIDLVTFAENPVGPTGFSGLGGSAYDASSDTYYLATRDGQQLIEADYALANGPTPAGTPIGALGVDFFHNGMELWDGTLYIATLFNNSANFELGAINPATGEYTFLQLINDANVGGQVALTITPSPSAAALLGLGGLVAARRRR